MKDKANNDQTASPIQLYKPRGSCDRARELLENGSLDAIIAFMEGRESDGSLSGPSSQPASPFSSPILSPMALPMPTSSHAKATNNEEVYRKRMELIWKRQEEQMRLVTQLDDGDARIDDDGRLVPVTELPQPPRANLPPPPPPGRARNRANRHHHQRHHHNRNNGNNAINANNINNNNNNNNNHPIGPGGGGGGNDDGIATRREQDAARAIERAVRRYRDANLPEDEFELVLIPIQPGRPANLTFRRTCFAVLAVVAAFVCVLLQTLPLFDAIDFVEHDFDPIMHELVHVRDFDDHSSQCPRLHRDETNRGRWLWSQLSNPFDGSPSIDPINCADGVLHLPSQVALINRDIRSFERSAATSSLDHPKTPSAPPEVGFNVSWFMPCQLPNKNSGSASSESLHQSQRSLSQCFPPQQAKRNNGYDGHGHNGYATAHATAHADAQAHANICVTNIDDLSTEMGACGATPSSEQDPRLDSSASPSPSSGRGDAKQCFRGVHDGYLSPDDLAPALRLARSLIQAGGDHFDVHYDVSLLDKSIPLVLQRLREVFQTRYSVNTDALQPIAFRVNSIAPMDAVDVSLRTAVAMNGTNYVQWLENSRHQNDLANYSPWPFNVKPARDLCKLSSDLEADPRFAVYTAVDLSEGSGVHYDGGLSLYVDHHPSNANPKRRVRRGVMIDGSVGRVVISTGGLENRRCRLPVRSGVRAVLQIWWGCSD